MYDTSLTLTLPKIKWTQWRHSGLVNEGVSGSNIATRYIVSLSWKEKKSCSNEYLKSLYWISKPPETYLTHMCYRFMNLSSFQSLFGFHASESLSKLNKMSPLTRSQSPFCVYKVKGINACKNHKVAKNGGPLHVRHADINGLREGWKADRKHRWVPSSLTVINCIHLPVTRELLTCVQWHLVIFLTIH